MFFLKKNKQLPNKAPPRSPARFSFIVTAWGEKTSLLRKALNSVGEQLGEDGELLVILNQFEEDPQHTIKLLEVIESIPSVTRWCRISQNSGVVRAWNVGYHLAEGSIVFVMNGDCILQKGAVAAMLETFANPKVGIVGVGGIRDGIKVVTSGPCQAVYGFCFGVRRQTHEQIGGFDVAFSPLADEVEYCARANKAGWEVHIAHGAGFDHTCTISEQTDRDILYFGRLVDRNLLDKANMDYKIGLPWMEGKGTFKKQS
ncbi:MAG: glycosyltransferase [Magnetococcus sp. YQC-5]